MRTIERGVVVVLVITAALVMRWWAYWPNSFRPIVEARLYPAERYVWHEHGPAETPMGMTIIVDIDDA